MVQVNGIYLIFNHVPFLVDSSEVKFTNNFGFRGISASTHIINTAKEHFALNRSRP